MQNLRVSKKYYLRTFGCQMNIADSERFASIIEKTGYRVTENVNEADLIILNSCSVRQKAEDRVIGQGNKIKELKAKNSELKAVLTGCMARRSWRGVAKTGSPIQMTQESREAQLKKQMPWLDLVIETKDFAKLPLKLGLTTEPALDQPEFYLSFHPKISNNFQVYVPISVGCDHFCTFCIVPFARGGEVCRSATSIITEVETLVSQGYKDVTLLGQTVNRWINPKFDAEIKQGMIANTKIPGLNEKLLENKNENNPRDFLQLLQRLDQIPGDWWITFVSSHPNYMSRQLISFLATSRHFRPYLHFALQSGSDEILKRMNRRYTIAEFSAKVKQFRKTIPSVSISTDIIVGFPGETETQFLETAKTMRQLEFDMAFISEFSARKGTAAGLLKDDVTGEEKARRKNYLNDKILTETALKNNQKMLGTEQKVLVIKQQINKNQTSSFRYLGKTANAKDIIFISKKNLKPGDYVQINITKCTPWALSGELSSF